MWRSSKREILRNVKKEDAHEGNEQGKSARREEVTAGAAADERDFATQGTQNQEASAGTVVRENGFGHQGANKPGGHCGRGCWRAAGGF